MLQTGFKTAEETISMMISTVKDHIATTLLSSMYLKKKNENLDNTCYPYHQIWNLHFEGRTEYSLWNPK